MTDAYVPTRRDRLAWRLANWIINHLATRDYRVFLWVIYRDGVKALHARRADSKPWTDSGGEVTDGKA